MLAKKKIQDFSSPADALLQDLEKPLLSHSWSAAFSFAKCHLEEVAPYDPVDLSAGVADHDD